MTGYYNSCDVDAKAKVEKEHAIYNAKKSRGSATPLTLLTLCYAI